MTYTAQRENQRLHLANILYDLEHRLYKDEIKEAKVQIKTCIDFIKNFNPNQLIVITTAYPEYAVEGYELNILDYLLKPINLERFKKAAEKAIEYFNFFRHSKTDDFIFLKSGNKIEKIFLNIAFSQMCWSNYQINIRNFICFCKDGSTRCMTITQY